MIVHLKEVYVCDFCGKDQDEVKDIIVGPRKVAICDECVDISMGILVEKRKHK